MSLFNHFKMPNIFLKEEYHNYDWQTHDVIRPSFCNEYLFITDEGMLYYCDKESEDKIQLNYTGEIELCGSKTHTSKDITDILLIIDKGKFVSVRYIDEERKQKQAEYEQSLIDNPPPPLTEEEKKKQEEACKELGKLMAENITDMLSRPSFTAMATGLDTIPEIILHDISFVDLDKCQKENIVKLHGEDYNCFKHLQRASKPDRVCERACDVHRVKACEPN